MIDQYTSRSSYIFTSESVSEGHPDKVCDQISDAILDAFLTENPDCRAAIEVLASTNLLVIAGERRGVENVSKGQMDDIAREKVRQIGYSQEGFHWRNLDIHNHVHEQSADIAMGVDAGEKGLVIKALCLALPALKHQSLCPRRLSFPIRFYNICQRRGLLAKSRVLAQMLKVR